MSTFESLINEYTALNEQLAACIIASKTDIIASQEEGPVEANIEDLLLQVEEKKQEFKNKYIEIEEYVKNNAILKQVMLLRKIGMI